MDAQITARLDSKQYPPSVNFFHIYISFMQHGNADKQYAPRIIHQHMVPYIRDDKSDNFQSKRGKR